MSRLLYNCVLNIELHDFKKNGGDQMKKTWKKPNLEILDVSETMKRPKWPGHGGGGEENPTEPEDLFDS